MRRFWTPKEDAAVKALYPEMLTRDLATRLDRTERSIYQRARLHGLQKGPAFLASAASGRLTPNKRSVAHQFPKGHKTHNKGKKGWQAGGRASETKFKKGQMPHNWVPIGSERLSDGYLYRKIADTRSKSDWKMVHVMLWEEHNGPVPKDWVVIFRDGNKANLTIENLELITRADNMRRNTIHRYPPEIKQAMRTLGKLKRTIDKQTESPFEQQN